MPKIFFKSIFTTFSFLTPVYLFAQTSFQPQSITSACNRLGTNGDFSDFTDCVTDLAAGAFVPFIFSLALLAFAVGVFLYVRNADNEAKRTEYMRLIIWSLVGLFFMVGVWTFARMFAGFFGVNDVIIPQFR